MDLRRELKGKDW
ncbi:unnamed protein product [Linum tenue]|uniref:Uncharacterized protein n=1 Tax=Linum tenue TaxID=586396 RepID=A0AAV0MHX9_9ROSI|nr:unnamed protein product [Linum tenue]